MKPNRIQKPLKESRFHFVYVYCAGMCTAEVWHLLQWKNYPLAIAFAVMGTIGIFLARGIEKTNRQIRDVNKKRHSAN